MAVRFAPPPFLLPLLGELLLLPERVAVADGGAVASATRCCGFLCVRGGGPAVERVVADGARGGGAAETRSTTVSRVGRSGDGGFAAAEVAAGEGVVEIVRCGGGGGAWGLRETAVDSVTFAREAVSM